MAGSINLALYPIGSCDGSSAPEPFGVKLYDIPLIMKKQKTRKSEHLNAEVESLRSMLHRWFGIKKTEPGEEPAEQEPDEISDSQHKNSRES